MNSLTYYPAKMVYAPSRALQEGQQLPKGWSAVPILDREEPLKLRWSEAQHLISRPLPANCRLRIAIAVNYRHAIEVEVFLLKSGTVLDRFDIRYAYVFQPFELILTSDQAEAVLCEGIGLRLGQGDPPLWIFDELQGDQTRRLFSPHLLISEEQSPMGALLHSTASLSSLQPFGWLEGCVLDGLYALRGVWGADRIDQVLSEHLGQFLDDDGRLHYEDLYSRKVEGRFTTIEATLPLAVIVKLWPQHPVVTQALSFWLSEKEGSGLVIDGDTVSAEGAYTVAYPLAAAAARLHRKELAELAVKQLLLRRDRLANDNHIYLRYHQKKGDRSFRSWARAFAWYMLGMTRTWIELQASPYADLPGINDIKEEIQRISQVALDWRLSGGLWSCFLDEPATGVEISGSAGIATALALGARHGLLQPVYLSAAREALMALERYITPDGIVSGVAQHNAGGLELQRCGYRVLSQMGMGLVAQLYALVHSDRSMI